jgi:hypothetical protein
VQEQEEIKMATDTPIFITLSFILFGLFAFAFLYEGTTTSINLFFPSTFQFSPATICNNTASVNASVISVGGYLQAVGTSLQGASTPFTWSCSVQTFLYYFVLPIRIAVWVLQLIFSLLANIAIILAVAIGAFSKLPIMFNLLFVMPLSLIWGYMLVRLIRGV